MGQGSDVYAKVVLSTDTKPDGAFAGQLIIESDTKDVFEWAGTEWNQKTTGGAVYVLPTDTDGTPVNLALEETVSQLVMAISTPITEIAYDLNAAAFSETTAITNDYEFDSVELNFSTAEAKTITITSSDGTILWGGDVDQTAANQGYLTTAQNFYLGFNHRGFDGGDNITIAVTQFSSPGTMDCVLRTKSGTNSLLGNPHTGWLGTDGAEYGYQLAGGVRPRVSVVDYKHEIAAGNLESHVVLPGFGERDSIQLPVGGIGEDIWEGVATVIPHPAVAGEQMTVVSTSVEDGVAGTGVITIRIQYIQASDGQEATEDITMDGTTPVNTTATDIAFINHMFTTSIGSNGVAVGNIDIYKLGDSSTVYNRIITGGNKDLTVAIRIPTGKTYFINEWHCSVTGNKPTAVRLRSTDWNGILYNGDDPVFIFKDTAFLAEGNFDRDLDPPIKVPGGSTIKISAWAQQAGAFASGSFGGFYEDE